MPIRHNSNQPLKTQELSAIESRLIKTLKPVAPREDFVLGLKEKLVRQMQMLPYLTRFSRSYVLLMALLLIVLGLTLLLLILRAIITLIGVTKLYQYYQKRDKLDKLSVLPGAE